ncbi:hypothetical protein [Anaerosporobacter sp.]
MSATAFQRMRREAEAKAKASQIHVEESQEQTDQEDQTEVEQNDADINLDDMSVEELTQYATEYGIDIGNATSQKGILKKIKEVE